ncbi:MAG: hypothetical protein LUH19_06060 [Lachnospiraceae bacterium]|nr:hypothetical protein [Lachnospiraceae bacterium]
MENKMQKGNVVQDTRRPLCGDRKCVRQMIQLAGQLLKEETVPQKGSFQPCTVQFHIEGSVNIAFLRIESVGEDQRRLKIGVTDEQSRYSISQLDFKGSNEQIAEYLSKEELENDWYERFMKMSEKWSEKQEEYPHSP